MDIQLFKTFLLVASSQIIQFDLSNEKLVWIAKRELVVANNNCQDISYYSFINF
ncbi:hypothetical protein Ga0466249_005121 [Sporomusaceae bacterium BoRhaA]|nr:hypothetical protein [Pelorhabdus rhamnosifermentans]